MARLRELVVSLRTDNARLRRDVNRSRREIRQFGRNVERDLKPIAASFRAIRAGFAVAIPAAITAGTLAIARGVSQYVDQVAKLATATRTSEQFVAGLGFALEQTGSQAQSARTLLLRSSQAVEQAFAGLATPTRGLRALGIELDELRGLNVEQTFRRILEGLGSIEDARARLGAAGELFGTRNAQAVANLAGQLGPLADRFDELSGSITPAQARNFEAFNDSLNEVKVAARGAFIQLAPLIGLLAGGISRAAETIAFFRELGGSLIAIAGGPRFAEPLLAAKDAAFEASQEIARLQEQLAEAPTIQRPPIPGVGFVFDFVDELVGGTQSIQAEIDKQQAILNEQQAFIERRQREIAELLRPDLFAGPTAAPPVFDEIVVSVEKIPALFTDVERAAQSLVERTRSPLEQFKRAIDEIAVLRELGEITAETAARAGTLAGEQYLAAIRRQTDTANSLLADAATTAAQAAGNAFEQFLFRPFEISLRSIGRGIANLGAQILATIARVQTLRFLSGLGGPVGRFFSLALPTRHSGGRVGAGLPYLVKPDEELFVPDSPGMVLSGNQLGNIAFNNTFNLPAGGDASIVPGLEAMLDARDAANRASLIELMRRRKIKGI